MSCNLDLYNMFHLRDTCHIYYREPIAFTFKYKIEHKIYNSEAMVNFEPKYNYKYHAIFRHLQQVKWQNTFQHFMKTILLKDNTRRFFKNPLT